MPSPLALTLLGVHAAVLAVTAANRVYWWRERRRPLDLDGPFARLSILVPARNEEANLPRLLASLLAQDHPDFEVIVVDDGSEDGTWDVLEAHADARLRPIRSAGPKPGWIGKVHALHTAAAAATGATFLFLDADTALSDAGALRRLAARHAACGPDAVLTGLPCFRGGWGGLLLTSLVPAAILTGLPLPLVPRTRMPALSALNGQVWMIDADAYRRHDPHAAHAAEVLEDVRIGRYLKGRGMRLYLLDLGPDLSVWMYRDGAEAWRGFRKNAYLLLGGRPRAFAVGLTVYAGVFVLPPLVWPPLLATLYAIKLLSDQAVRIPLAVTAAAPLTFVGGALLALASARAHARRRVTWKGRTV